jgi:hypothetical protein
MTNQGWRRKRPWEKPVIKVLVSTQTQEAVLASCKEHFSFLGGPGSLKCDSGIWSLVCSDQNPS